MGSIKSLRRKIALQANAKNVDVVFLALERIETKRQIKSIERARSVTINMYGKIKDMPSINQVAAHIAWSNSYQHFETKPCTCEYCSALQKRVYAKIQCHRAKNNPLNFTLDTINKLKDNDADTKKNLRDIKDKLLKPTLEKL